MPKKRSPAALRRVASLNALPGGSRPAAAAANLGTASAARIGAARTAPAAPPALPAAPSAPEPEILEPDLVTGRPFPIVGIGASAGGFEAFRQLLHELSRDTGMAFVLVQHLDPGHESMLTKLLSRATQMPVTEVKDGMGIEPNHVYVIPPNTTMEILDGVLRLRARDDPAARHLPVDSFFHSLAAEQGSRAIGVILSGTASDGTLGLKAIKAEGGITFAQDEGSSKYFGMPGSAVAAGCVDFVLPPEAIAAELARIGRHPYVGVHRPSQTPPLPAEGEGAGDGQLRKIFGMLRNATGVDFTHYKYSTIKRRIARRMVVHKMETVEQYIQYIGANRGELEDLYEDFLIHVTEFFRDPEAFQKLQEIVFPAIVEAKAPGETLRIWTPGCSTGEELYSIAIALLEYLGDKAAGIPIQMFGTDISETSIEKARAGVYPESSLVGVSPERLRRFFAQVNGHYQINKTVREMCIFARQDLGKDPPFSRLALVSCRNVLIYMGPLLQKKIMNIFHYALKPTGFLLLGKSESISGYSRLFTLADRNARIYSRRASAAQFLPELAAPDYAAAVPDATRVDHAAPAAPDVAREADRLLLDRYAPAGLVVNENLQILQFRGQCSPYVEPSPGEASLGILRLVRPEFALHLRTAILRARKEAGPVRVPGIRFQWDGKEREANLEVIPIAGKAGLGHSFLVVFEEDMPQAAPARRAALEKRQQPREADQLRGELQVTRDYLQSVGSG